MQAVYLHYKKQTWFVVNMKLSLLCVVVGLVLRASVLNASSFRGATVQWSPMYSGTEFTGMIQISHQLSWVRTSTEGGHCDATAVLFSAQNTLGNTLEAVLQCRSGCRGNIGSMSYQCSDFSTINNWSNGNRFYTYTHRVEVFEASFVSVSGSWVPLANVPHPAAWEVRVRFNLTERVETGRVNTSPTTIFFPGLKHQHGCTHIIRVPVFDADGDVVRCRWAENDECGDVCMQFPGELDPNTCTIEYSANVTQGFYAVAIQVEDFAAAGDTQPLSSVPVQFLVEVIDMGLHASCDSRLELVGDTPADGTCFLVPLLGRIMERITIRAPEDEVVTEVSTASLMGTQKSALVQQSNRVEWAVSFTWTALAILKGPHFLCFAANGDNSLPSLVRCITLLAEVSPARVVSTSFSPRGLINQTKLIEWSMQFDLPFVRPSVSAFIRVFAEDGEEVASIDVSLSDSVFYPDTRISQTLRFITNFTAVEGTTYHVLVDSGVAVTNGACMTRSRPINDPTRWTVSVIVPDPCLSGPCDINATCVREGLLSTNFTCTCQEPFTGDGFNCTAPDPCQSAQCDVNAECVGDGLLFTCTCIPPFVRSGLNCTILDPCLSGPCDVNATCVREGLLSTNFTCTCQEPFTGDGFNCTVPTTMTDSSTGVIIASVLSVFAVLGAFFLIGALYGYVRVLFIIKRSMQQQ